MVTSGKLGRYEIEELIGSGGMGKVYRARDPQLDRLVALKVLLPEFTGDTERVKRFLYEAKAVSALNHPGIITIHEIVNDESGVFIATEYVEGATIRDLLEKGQMDTVRAVSVSEQVADSLAAAHKAGIIHRDIKPENIMIRKDGLVKLLDFGLAKPLLENALPESKKSKDVNTQPGLVIGSVRYMSPEQARGKDTDQRTDIWSLGVVMYELLSSENPFDGETVSDQLAAVIHTEPPLLDLENEALARIIAKCLNKDRAGRYHDAEVLARELRELRLAGERNSGAHELDPETETREHETSENKTLIHKTLSAENTAVLRQKASTNQHTVETPRAWKRFAPAAALLLILGMVAVGFAIWNPFAGNPANFENIVVTEFTDNGESTAPAISPDGKFVAYASLEGDQTRLVVNQVATGSEVEVVPPRRGAFLQPTFSHDGSFIYYVTVSKGVGTLYQVTTLGGESIKIAEDIDSRPSVSHDGKLITFLRHDPSDGGDKVLVVDVGSKEVREVAESGALGLIGIRTVAWSHDGAKIYLVGLRGTRANMASELFVLDAATGKKTSDRSAEEFGKQNWSSILSVEVLPDNSGFVFTGKQTIGANLQVWHFNGETGALKQITKDTNDYNLVSVSHDLKTIVTGRAEWNSGLYSVDVTDERSEEIVGFDEKFLGKYGVAVSTSGVIVYPYLDREQINLYSLDPLNGNRKQLTKDAGLNAYPVFSPNNEKIVYSSSFEGEGLWMMNPDGSEKERLTTADGSRDSHAAFIRDGKEIVFIRQKVDGSKADVMVIPATGGNPKKLLPDSKTSDIQIAVAPDTSRIAVVGMEYDEANAKLNEKIRIVDLSSEKPVTSETELSLTSGRYIVWSRDGKGLTMLKRGETNDFWDYPVSKGDPRKVLGTRFDDTILFTWYANGSKMLVVRGYVDRDLILVRNEDNS